MDTDRLDRELRTLGRTVHVPPVDGHALAVAVLDRLADEERTPARRPVSIVGQRRRAVRVAWWPVSVVRRRWRVALAALTALLVMLALTPPVRATVADWLGIGGVAVRSGTEAPDGAAQPPRAEQGLTLEEARDLVGFEPVVPTELGTPDGVEVSADRQELSMTWEVDDGVIRLDQFAHGLYPRYVKELVPGGEVEIVLVDGQTAFWFPEPHRLVLVDENGRERVDSTRSAGPTLVWEAYSRTLRLEGLEKRPAQRIGASLRPE